jgi:2-succinyl-6-hydroxy-2,4-cyclohexadiene-1-carboxylate synthase
MSKRTVDPNEVLLIPGFLGDEAFFQPFQAALTSHGVRSRVWQGLLENPRALLPEHARSLPDHRWMVGYSLGGRILMHRILDDSVPALEFVTLVSAHTGLPETAFLERAKREESDEEWARKLEDSTFSIEEFLSQWNSQGVFQGGRAHTRSQESLAHLKERRKDWAWILRQTSLATQADLAEELRGLPKSKAPLWVCGEHDGKFSDLYATLESRGVPGEVWRVPQSGHRVPQDTPAALARKIASEMQRRNFV